MSVYYYCEPNLISWSSVLAVGLSKLSELQLIYKYNNNQFYIVVQHPHYHRDRPTARAHKA